MNAPKIAPESNSTNLIHCQYIYNIIIFVKFSLKSRCKWRH